jgi:hypothetical protein
MHNYSVSETHCFLAAAAPQVAPDTFSTMYGVDAEEMDSFCTACCRYYMRKRKKEA